MDFSYKKMLGKGLKYFAIFLIAAYPFLEQFVPPDVKSMNVLEFIGYLFPLLKTLTFGSILVMLVNWAKIKKQLDIP